MRRRRIGLAVATLLLIAVSATRHPSADIRLMMHDPADPAPHRMQAALDLGLVGVSLLYTWTSPHLR
ncbi:hypothetical protein SAMN05192583_1366 [Sphingomonas gellani]|uniref:Uncharacterized protein n=1 Tax=Sphingomonas gellani TaxID=1166340 RepID=A0A1H8BJF8_9SPHN|nr:hypothetical protein [Sphingomonas gellani]SEM82188.1 hypothetical protein SAMN05192583_1366 [Sphingomonas gellani]